MQLNGHGLAPVRCPGIIGRLIRRSLPVIRGGTFSFARRARGLNQVFKVGRRIHRNEHASGGQIRNPIFAQIVCALRCDLLPMFVPGRESLTQSADFRPG